MMADSDRPKRIAGMPAYNEGKYIGSLVLQARQYVDEVIVVDDGSSDDTARVAELAGASVIRHTENRGYGSAIQGIMAEARQRDAGVLVILDADSQHDPAEIPSLIKAVSAGADVVIGSRESQKDKIAAYRRAGQKVLAGMTAIAAGHKLSDTESGFRAYSRKALLALKLKEQGMAISSEIVSEAISRGLKVVEVPISVIYTGDGSTMNPVRHGLGVFSRILVMISERRPLLVFGACGCICIAFGLIMGVLVVQTLFAQQVLQVGSALIAMMLITVGMLSIFTGLILNVLMRRISDRL